ncbi:MAG: DUF4290 domain-containing protein [Clostridia bacterium]|nr:DUF4290 domain-containing protein [Clostridia bacterium]
MKSKRIIIIAIIVLSICAIAFGIFKATHSDNYLYNQDGTISDGHQELIEHLKEIEDKEERKKQIDFSLEQSIITQEEANELY